MAKRIWSYAYVTIDQDVKVHAMPDEGQERLTAMLLEEWEPFAVTTEKTHLKVHLRKCEET